MSNELLREHVTSTGFALTLGKTHVASLVMLDTAITHKSSSVDLLRGRNNFVSGIHGCIDRGLVEHHYQAKWQNRPGNHLGRHYSITKAGRLVIALLKEAGLYQEYAGFVVVDGMAS